MATTTEAALLKGGAWLIEPTRGESVLTPEKLTEEHKLIAQTTEQFVEQEVVPVLDQLEQHDWTLARTLLKRCGELGLLGVDVPEEYGGLALDKVTSLIVSEMRSKSASFGATFGAETNVTTLPMMLFGAPAQNPKYRPTLLTAGVADAY